MLIQAAAFPFRRDNATFLAVGTLLCSLPPVVGLLLPGLPYFDIIGLLVEGAVMCYVLVYFQGVLEASTRGDERLPMWPEEADWGALAGRAFHVIVPLVLSFMPLVAFVVWRVFATGTWRLEGAMIWTAVALFAGGCFYLPIALLIFSFYGETAVVNVVGAARSIARIGWAYVTVVGLLLALFTAYTMVGALIVSWPMPLAVPAGALLFFYCMIVSMRAVGLLYAHHRERLGWETQNAERRIR